MEWGVVAGIAFFFFCAFIGVYVFPRHIVPRLAKKQVEFRNKMQKKNYPQEVPNWQSKMLNCPFEPSEVEELFNDLADEWDIEFPDLKRDDIESKLHGLMVEWLPADPKVAEETSGGASRHIKDELGRIIAGDHDGDEVRVVYNEDDVAQPKWKRVGRTALAHESAHELDELLGIIDYDHRPEIYGSGGLVSRVKRKHS